MAKSNKFKEVKATERWTKSIASSKVSEAFLAATCIFTKLDTDKSLFTDLSPLSTICVLGIKPLLV